MSNPLLATGLRPLVPVVVLLVFSACDPPAVELPPTQPVPDIGLEASSAAGMVVSGSEMATRAGAEILEAGGNAIDAAVATAFALAVAEPTQSGLGGRTQAVVWRPDGTVFGVDGTTEVPASYDPDTAPEVEDGYGVVAIPGTVAALARLLEEGGTMPLAQVMAPAIRLADEGFALSRGEARRFADVRNRLALSEGARAAFLQPNGKSYGEGDVLVQPELAEVLRTIARDGPEAFYTGVIAERMVADFTTQGAFVTEEDLARYEAERSIVVRGHFGGLDLVGTYLPASGATTIEALQILDRLGLQSMEPEDAAFAVGRALLAAFEDREKAWDDVRPPVADAAWIVSDALADERAAQLRDTRTYTPSPNDEDVEPAHTTHVSVVDASGMAVAMTQSLGLTGGSRVATPGLGFLYAATLGGYLGYVEPGDRPWSSQSPLLAVRDGRLQYVLGGAGSRRIISALVQTLVRAEVERMSLPEALAAPRFHPTRRAWTFEERVDSEADPFGAASARSAGHEVVVRSQGVYFARLNVLALDVATGLYTGVADPRWAWGAASGPRAALPTAAPGSPR